MNNNFLDDRKAKVDNFKKEYRGKINITTKIDIPGGLFVKCEKCNEYLYHEDLIKNLSVCPKCRYHFRINSRNRLLMICDNNSFTELFCNLSPENPLHFPSYEEKLHRYQEETKEKDAFICGVAKINNYPCAIGVLDSHFMMGSMGSVVGEKVTRIIEHATSHKLPLIIFSASGGARMQEGIFSLMQMAKTSAAIKHHNNAGLLFISILTNPTTGGVAASFASLGDIIIAEKDALIGFAGQRVIKETLREDLPEGFQTAEFQLAKGQVDMVVERLELKKVIQTLLMFHQRGDIND